IPLTPVTVVLYENGFTMVALPPTKDHSPVPTAGSLAVTVKVLLPHCVMSDPATAADGASRLVTTTSSNVEAHTPLLIVQRKVTEVPAGTPVMVMFGSWMSPSVAVPFSIVQVPVVPAA